MTEYSKQLKDDSIKTKIIMGYHGDNKSSYELSREYGISPRAIQMFIGKQTHQDWWLANEDIVDNYFKGFQKSHQDNLGKHVTSPPTQECLGDGKSVPIAPHDNSRILLLSDMHIPYNHKDTLRFLQYLKDKYKPTRVLCLGDEVDHLALSYHEKETEAPSAFDELKMALPIIKQVEEMFPVMDILDSNHGSLAYRKAKTAGIPKHYLKSYADVLQVGIGWKWHFDMVIDLPTGQKCYLHHGKSSNITKTSQAMSMCSVAGHYHNTFKIEYWANPLGLYWGMQAGCLIDDKSFAFNYNNVNLHRPLIGTGLIINGLPVLEPMVLDSNGDWIQPK
jgi:hypothetical protein